MQIRAITLESCSVKSLSFCWRGVLISSVAVIASLIRLMAVEDLVPMAMPPCLLGYHGWQEDLVRPRIDFLQKFIFQKTFCETQNYV